jgi:hypothetical protein
MQASRKTAASKLSVKLEEHVFGDAPALALA